MLRTVIRHNEYHDSVFLLTVSVRLKETEGVHQAIVAMGTEMNKSVLRDTGMIDAASESASAKDLIIALEVDDESVVKRAIETLQSIVSSASGVTARNASYSSADLAIRAVPEANMALISVPGEFAALEAEKALDLGLNVFMFSDNVSVDDEVALKKKARSKKLLVMGPGCGTAVIGGVSLGMMSAVARGPIGIVGASGSGLHQIAAHIDRLGSGISQAIGTGGRDLSDAVGGISTLQGLDFLEQDPNTSIIVLVSKPPSPETLETILAKASSCKKPVIVFFIGGDGVRISKAGAIVAENLEDAARKAVALATGQELPDRPMREVYGSNLAALAKTLRGKDNGTPRYLRGLFSGGTLAEETALILVSMGLDINTNMHLAACSTLSSPKISVGHSIIDMGDEVFTKGKPHPVIDPSILKERLIEEAGCKETAVLLLDVLLGYGAHPNPVSVLLPSIREALDNAMREGRTLRVVVSLCGTGKDPQNMENQAKLLEESGATVLHSNSRAAYLCGLLVA